jgi:8-hydroxy-5-deazaflavin:NADPH oxidoreductase
MCNGEAMKIGIVGGTGPAGKALATRLAAGGAEVLVGSRSAERAQEIVAGLIAAWPNHALAIEGVTNEDAASAECIVIATPWEGAVATALELSGLLEGKTVISMVNALARMGREFQALVPVRGSIAATIQSALPRSKVTAAFQHLPARELGDLTSTLAADVLICADDDESAAATAAVVGTMDGLRAVHCGSLASANAVEALTAVFLNVNIRYKAHVALRLEGLPD